MADSFIGASQLILINDKNANDLGVSDLFDDAPLITKLSATVASNGTQHKYLKETVAPVVGFRTINSGTFNSNSTDVEVTVALQIIAASFAVDKSGADSYYKGASEFIAREMRRQLRATMFGLEYQIVNGTVGGSASGFTGFADTLSSSANSMVLKQSGSTAGTGSSVYLVRTNDLGRDVQFVLGNGGNIQADETVIQQLTDSNGKHYPAYYTPVEGWGGVQMGSALSVARIANLTGDTGAKLTDAMISAALGLFPASRQPNLIVMGRRSLAQLQASRTAFSPSGQPALIPNDAFNIPIVVTDGCTATETLIS